MKYIFKIPLLPIMSKKVQLCLLLTISIVISSACIATDIFGDDRPNEHRCPITLEVMQDPVIADDGRSYERTAISDYFNTVVEARSPITNLPLNNKNLVANLALKNLINEWKPSRQSQPSQLETRNTHVTTHKVEVQNQRDELDNAICRIRNLATSRILDSGPNKNVYTLPENGGNYQKWITSKQALGIYTLRNVATGFMLDSGPHKNVYTLEGNPGNYQKWIINKQVNNVYTLTSLATSFVLDSDYKGNVYTLENNNGTHQRWKVEIIN